MGGATAFHPLTVDPWQGLFNLQQVHATYARWPIVHVALVVAIGFGASPSTPYGHLPTHGGIVSVDDHFGCQINGHSDACIAAQRAVWPSAGSIG